MTRDALKELTRREFVVLSSAAAMSAALTGCSKASIAARAGDGRDREMHEGILVAYASRYGSTREVAAAVGEELRRHGKPVNVCDVSEVDAVTGYEAVVLGSALYLGSILKSASSFLNRHQTALARLPVAVFAMGPLKKSDGTDDAAGQLAKELQKTPWLRPIAQTVFVGKYDPSHLNIGDRLIAALPASPLHGQPARDDRDWEAIREWARVIRV